MNKLLKEELNKFSELWKTSKTTDNLSYVYSVIEEKESTYQFGWHDYEDAFRCTVFFSKITSPYVVSIKTFHECEAISKSEHQTSQYHFKDEQSLIEHLKTNFLS